jgi:hypothetical protein
VAGIEKAQVISVRDLPSGSERLIQDLIANDPSILTLGPLVLRDKERIQPTGGRLDILLQDEDATAWYEVEVQLGKTDESHIIRTIEYWDRERRRYPDIRHTAVIVAEEINGRFFNVISLFNQSIPIIAMKLSAFKLNDQYGIIFTKVLDYERKGLETEDDYRPTTRKDWEGYAPPTIMDIADKVLMIAKESNSVVEFKYNKNYISTTVDGAGSNLIYLMPQKKQMKLWVSLKSGPELDKLCEEAGFDPIYSSYWRGYQFDLRPGDIENHRSFFKNFIGRLYVEDNSALLVR